jgi:DNA polymerase III sliding clamp (beta) subunit (PCNA family)
LNIREYNAQNMGKQVLVLQEKEIKSLMHFSSIAKNQELNGLIISGKYVGVTDTYRMAVIKDTREELQGSDKMMMYSADALEELKKAHSMAVLNNGKLAIQVGSEVTEYEPVNRERVPDIKVFIEGYEYGSHTKARSLNKITDDLVWKMLKLIDSSDEKRYFSFEDGKLIVEAYPNGNSVLLLDVLELDNKGSKLKTTLNFKYMDLWLKYVKDEKFDIALAKNNRNACQFRKDNLFYIVMPVALRD